MGYADNRVSKQLLFCDGNMRSERGEAKASKEELDGLKAEQKEEISLLESDSYEPSRAMENERLDSQGEDTKISGLLEVVGQGCACLELSRKDDGQNATGDKEEDGEDELQTKAGQGAAEEPRRKMDVKCGHAKAPISRIRSSRQVYSPPSPDKCDHDRMEILMVPVAGAVVKELILALLLLKMMKTTMLSMMLTLALLIIATARIIILFIVMFKRRAMMVMVMTKTMTTTKTMMMTKTKTITLTNITIVRMMKMVAVVTMVVVVMVVVMEVAAVVMMIIFTVKKK